MYAIRLYSVRRSRYMEVFYSKFEAMLVKLAPVLNRIGYERLEKPVAALERGVKGLLFDCQMCGQCALSSTGMSCSMNCPKNLRNGPCGGVRPNGNCEVKPEMKCVWVQAWDGAKRMQSGMAILEVQKPVDHRLKGRSSWLKVLRDKTEPAPAPKAAPAPPKTGPSAAEPSAKAAP